MRPRHLVSLVAATLAIVGLSFQFGRHAAHAARTENAIKMAKTAGAVSPAPSTTADPDAVDLSRVRISNIGLVAFEHAYDLLRSAPREQLTLWAQQLQAMPTGPARTTAIASFFKLLVQIDPATAVDVALGLTIREARGAATGAIANAAPPTGFPEVGRMLATLGYSTTDLILAWSRVDPKAASDFVREHPTKVDDDALAALVSNWATIDPTAAKAWVESVDAARRKPEFLASFIVGWFETDRADAIDYLLENESVKGFKRATRSVAAILFSESPEAATAFVLQLRDPKTRDAAVDSIAALATSRFIGGSNELSPDVVARWMVTLPPEVWNEHLGYVVSHWNGADAPATDAWLNQLSQPLRDQVAASFCKAYQWDEPQNAFVAGLSITDGALRQKTLRELRDKVGTRETADKLMAKMQLSRRDKEEIEKVFADL